MKIGQLSFVQLTEPAAAPVRQRRPRLEVPGPAGPDAQPLLAELPDVILVTGGTGFVGPKVVHALRAAGARRARLVRKPGRAGTLQAWGCELVEGDVTDAASLRRAVEGCDAVVHLVAIIAGSRRDFERVMTQGTRDLRRRGEGRRRAPVRADERARRRASRRRTSSRTTSAKWEMEQAVRRARASST